ncbi:MAG: hypothetical protein ACHP65_04970 [Legionellales bacterium]
MPTKDVFEAGFNGKLDKLTTHIDKLIELKRDEAAKKAILEPKITSVRALLQKIIENNRNVSQKYVLDLIDNDEGYRVLMSDTSADPLNVLLLKNLEQIKHPTNTQKLVSDASWLVSCLTAPVTNYFRLHVAYSVQDAITGQLPATLDGDCKKNLKTLAETHLIALQKPLMEAISAVQLLTSSVVDADKALEKELAKESIDTLQRVKAANIAVVAFIKNSAVVPVTPNAQGSSVSEHNVLHQHFNKIYLDILSGEGVTALSAKMDDVEKDLVALIAAKEKKAETNTNIIAVTALLGGVNKDLLRLNKEVTEYFDNIQQELVAKTADVDGLITKLADGHQEVNSTLASEPIAKLTAFLEVNNATKDTVAAYNKVSTYILANKATLENFIKKEDGTAWRRFSNWVRNVFKLGKSDTAVAIQEARTMKEALEKFNEDCKREVKLHSPNKQGGKLSNYLDKISLNNGTSADNPKKASNHADIKKLTETLKEKLSAFKTNESNKESSLSDEPLKISPGGKKS